MNAAEAARRFNEAFFLMSADAQGNLLAGLFAFVDHRIQIQAVEMAERKAAEQSAATIEGPNAPRTEAGEGAPSAETITHVPARPSPAPAPQRDAD